MIVPLLSPPVAGRGATTAAAIAAVLAALSFDAATATATAQHAGYDGAHMAGTGAPDGLMPHHTMPQNAMSGTVSGTMPGTMSGTMSGGMSVHGHPHHAPPPAGVMGAHMVGKGRFMTMYSARIMRMGESRIGTRRVSPEEIVSSVPNAYFGLPMQPRTLRVAPKHMTMQGHMFSLRYGLTNDLNISVMARYIEKEMVMTTYAGPAGTVPLVDNVGKTKGLGDTVMALTANLYKRRGQQVHVAAGLSLPTGSITEEGTMIMPNGQEALRRRPYGMQLGSGTYDFMPTLTYLGRQGAFSWGAQYKARLPLEEANDEGWRFGNRHMVTGWVGYAFAPRLNGTLRVAGSTSGTIKGFDDDIMGPFQGTHTEFYGGERIEVFAGMNGHLKLEGFGMARIGVEAGVPVYQNLNGPQLERDWSLAATVGVHF